MNFAERAKELVSRMTLAEKYTGICIRTWTLLFGNRGKLAG